jgi:hypothetical protein
MAEDNLAMIIGSLSFFWLLFLILTFLLYKRKRIDYILIHLIAHLTYSIILLYKTFESGLGGTSLLYMLLWFYLIAVHCIFLIVGITVCLVRN